MDQKKDKRTSFQSLSADNTCPKSSLPHKARKKYYEGMDFTGRDLALGDFRKCRFVRCVFSQTVLSGAIFHSAIFDTCSFSEADLSCADMRQLTCIKTSFAGVKMHHADASDSVFEQSEFLNVTCEGAKFDAVIMDNCHMDGCNARGLSMRSSRIEKSVFRKSDFSAGHFERTLWKKACLEECDMSFAVARWGKLKKSQFKNNSCRGLDFTGVKGLSLEEANAILSHGGVVKRSAMQRLWKMRYGKLVAVFLFAGLIFGLLELALDPRLETTDVILKQTQQAIRGGYLEKAERLLAIASRRDLFPYQVAWLCKSRGDYFKKKGKKEQAKKEYMKAKDLSWYGYSLDARAEIACLYQAERQYGEALQEFESLLAVVPAWDIGRSFWIRIIMGDVYRDWGKYYDAIRMYEKSEAVKGISARQIAESQKRQVAVRKRMR